jgi:hypothetical protein
MAISVILNRHIPLYMRLSYDSAPELVETCANAPPPPTLRIKAFILSHATLVRNRRRLGMFGKPSEMVGHGLTLILVFVLDLKYRYALNCP